MKSVTILFVVIFQALAFNCLAVNYGWVNIGERLPNTVSTATVSDIAMIGDSMWVTSGYGTYQNQVPGEIYFSTDRGRTFSIQTTKYGTHAIHMISSKLGWCGGVEGQIYRTTNGGEVWERLYSLSRTLMDIDFPPGSDTGMCTGFNGGVKMITPNGLVSVNMQGYVSNTYSVSCIDAEHAFVAGEEIIGPITMGVLQIDQSYPGTNGIYAIDMVDTLRGWCVGSPTAAGSWDSSGCMIIRTDNGHDWYEQVNPVKGKSGTLMAVKALNYNEVWAVGTSGVVLHTTDGGDNWIREAIGLTNVMLYGIHVVSPTEVYVTGNNRTLLKYGPLSDVDDRYDKDDNLSVSPNPSDGELNVFINLKKASNVSAGVYDMTGRKIMNLFDKYLGAGTIAETFDASCLPNGIYLIKIDAGLYSLYEKFIILK